MAEQLYAAYCTAIGKRVIPSWEMERRLLLLASADFTPADVTAVVEDRQWHLRNRTKGFTEASLSANNVFNVDDFQARALRLRDRKAAKEALRERAARRVPAAEARPDEAATEAIRAKVKRDAEEFRRKMTGGGL